MVDHGERVADDLDAGADDSLCAFDVAGRHHGDFDAAAGTAPDFFLVALEDVEGTGTDGADAQQACFDGFHDFICSLFVHQARV